MTYTIEYALGETFIIEHVAAEEVPGILASITENDGRIKDIIAER